MNDFFISYNKNDSQTACYLDQWLREVGFSTFMQKRDFPPSSYIPEKMEEGMKARRLLAVLSPNYLGSDYCRAEMQSAFMRDPLNKSARIVIVKIAKCAVPELCAPISRIELVETGSHVRELFLSGIRALPPVKPWPRNKTRLTALSSPAAPVSPSTGVAATASGKGGIAVAAGRDVKFYMGDGPTPRGRAKPPEDVVSDDQAVRLSELMKEVIELDSGSPDGKRLSTGELQRKWWGALSGVVPKTTYTNYSQAKFKRAMGWLRAQRGRLISGFAHDEPELSRSAAIRAIHTFIARSGREKRPYYDELSKRLGIVPPFTSSKDLSDYDIRRVYLATRRDARGR